MNQWVRKCDAKVRFTTARQVRTNKLYESGPMMMARSRRSLLGPFRRWWESKSDSHFQIITYITILSVAATLWGIIFLFILNGASDPTKSEYVSWSWFGLIFGGLIAFYIVPEFFVYLSQKSILDDILTLDSRPEVIRRRGEAEEAALMLGLVYQENLISLYERLGIKPTGRLKQVSKSRKKIVIPLNESTDDGPQPIATENSSGWFNTRESHLSRILPGAIGLRDPMLNRLIIAISGISSVSLLYNMIFGLAAMNGETREYTVDLTLWLSGEDSIHSLSPHFDGVSIILTASALTLLYLTTPAPEITIQGED